MTKAKLIVILVAYFAIAASSCTITSKNTTTLKVESSSAKAKVYVVNNTKLGKHPDNSFPKDWENLFYPWLLPNEREKNYIGNTPIRKTFPPGRYLVGVSIPISEKDPLSKFIEVGHGAFWAEEGKDFDYFSETLGLRISKNGQRFTPKALADNQDPFKTDEYVGTYVHHLGIEILYFRIYRVNLRSGAVTGLVCKLEKKTDADLPRSEVTGAKGLLRGFTAEVPIYQ
jgi:hypothetical protein